MAVAVAVFRYEQIVPDQKGRFHGSGGNTERLEEQSLNPKRNQQGLEHDSAAFCKPAFLALSFSGYAHRPLVFRWLGRQGFRYFGGKRIGALRSAHEVSGFCAAWSMSRAEVTVPDDTVCSMSRDTLAQSHIDSFKTVQSDY